MCGIYAYIGLNKNATQAVFSGLKRLDYRGYDSWGIGILKDKQILLTKHLGEITQTEVDLPESSVAIGHTRWATNGAVTIPNAHPHISTDGSFILAQNGIVENESVLRADLVDKGYVFNSETDTEVIVRLIEEQKKSTPDFVEAVRLAFNKLEGRNTIIILTTAGQIIAARNGSPLVIGLVSGSSEIYFSSDVFSFSQFADQVVVMENGQMAVCGDGPLKIINTNTGQPVKIQAEINQVSASQVDKNGFDHYMIKEINEEPEILRKVALESGDDLIKFAAVIKKARLVYCVGSGTAGAAAAQMSYYLRVWSGINAVSLLGAESRDYYSLIGGNDLLIALSQSGETADVLEVIEQVKKSGVKIASYVNMPGSMITRLSDYAFMAHAGPEISVMSTKIFLSQLAWGYLISRALSGNLETAKTELASAALSIKELLLQPDFLLKIRQLAKLLAGKQHIFIMGKGQNVQIAREGMIKIIESSYIHAHAIPAGDLKHYAITLMEPGVPVIVILSGDDVRKEVLNAMHEVKARGAYIIGISAKAEAGFDEFLPVPESVNLSALINIIPLQLLAYYMAVELGHNVDKPRNIAKSVTVK
jgi:glucosamine--fructose-6-phosphate aminotransferase (isomerizing)